MAEGKNKIARSLLDLQPTAILDFYKIYPDIVNKPTQSINIHAGSVFGEQLVWQGVKYDPVPVECEGFEITANGRLPRPKIRIANKDFLVTKLLQNNDDLKNGQIIRKRTFVKYIDDVNFDGGNPFGDADSTAEISEEKFVIGQKTQENKILVELELTSPLDLENFELNHRRILGKYCYWQYRGNGCGYQGLPIERENGDPFQDSTGGYVVPDPSILNSFNSSNPNFIWNETKIYNVSDIAFIENPNIKIQVANEEGGLTLEAMKTWYVCVSGNSGQKPENNPTYWQKDGCSKKLSACKKRFLEGAHEGYVSADLDIEKDYIQFSGLGITQGGEVASGYFASTDPSLTDFFTEDFTIAMYLEPQGGEGTVARYLDTKSGSLSDGFALSNKDENLGINYNYDAGTRFDGLPFGLNRLGRTAIFLQHDKLDKTLYVKSAIDKGSLVTNYEETIIQAGGSNFVWNVNSFIIGANVVSATNNPTVRAKYYNIAIWDSLLDDNKLGKLLTFEKDSSASRFIRYEDAGSDLTGNSLIAWYENTGTAGSYDIFEDSHTGGFDLTGFGNYKLDTEDYKLKVLQTFVQETQNNWLPFGGFPGTDGFSYQSP
jgi:lambda family phage minor tail protein L